MVAIRLVLSSEGPSTSPKLSPAISAAAGVVLCFCFGVSNTMKKHIKHGHLILSRGFVKIIVVYGIHMPRWIKPSYAKDQCLRIQKGLPVNKYASSMMHYVPFASDSSENLFCVTRELAW